MSEKVYAWLLRLFPSDFRETYGDEALQLFRDRARDEKGFFPRLRLWLDLLVDLAISLPREYFHAQPELAGASAAPMYRGDGVPSFYALADESPRAPALLCGGVLTLAALGTFWLLLLHAGSATRLGTLWLGKSLDGFAFHRRQVARGDSEDKDSATNQAVLEGTKLDAAERRRVIQGAIETLKQHYIDPAVAQKTADAMRAHEKNGDNDAVVDGEAFANLLSKQMRDASHDRHLDLFYSPDPLPQQPLATTPESIARYRQAMEHENCTFEKVEVLAHNIGYLKINSFPDPAVCRSTAVAAMARLNDADAIIFDLRDNRGGEPAMVALMGAYLFDHPEYWYNPRENTTQRSWTHSPVPGSKLAQKPVYVLTSARTFSGAEQFCYNLKMLRRATLVGETTGGGVHSGVWHRIDDHFGMAVPETKPINPYSETDWSEIGVEPDLKVKAADALQRALNLAESELQKKKAS